MTTTGRHPAPANASQPGMPWLNHYPRGVDWHMPLKVAPLYRLLDDAAAGFPHLPCTNFLGKTLTYREIAVQVERATLGLQRLGVRKGTKVGLFLPNSPTFIVFFFAVLKAGGTVVNFNPLYTVAELTHQVKDSDTELMVTLDLKLLFDKVEALLEAGCLKRAVVASFPALLPIAKATLFRLFRSKELARPLASPAREKIVLEAEVMAGDGHPEKVVVDPMNDVAVLQYTGGTTGTPKGAMLSHANMLRERPAGCLRRTGPRGRCRARVRRIALLPCVRVDCCHEPSDRTRGRDHHNAAVLRSMTH